MIYWVKPACPKCGSEELRNNGSRPLGVRPPTHRYYECRECGKTLTAWRMPQSDLQSLKRRAERSLTERCPDPPSGELQALDESDRVDDAG